MSFPLYHKFNGNNLTFKIVLYVTVGFVGVIVVVYRPCYRMKFLFFITNCNVVVLQKQFSTYVYLLSGIL